MDHPFYGQLTLSPPNVCVSTNDTTVTSITIPLTPFSGG